MKANTPQNKQTHILTEGSILKILRETYLERKSRNNAYSLSSFARDLGISKSVLSRILSSERPVSVKLALHLSAVLELDENQSKRVLLAVIKSQSKNAKISKKLRAKLEHELNSSLTNEEQIQFTDVDIEQFKMMCNWYHLAILNLMRLKNFKMNPLWIAQRLGISTTEVRDAIDRLTGLGLILETEGIFKRSSKSFYIKSNKSEFAIRKFHEQMIDKAKTELKEISQERFGKRLINGITFTCAEEHIPLIKNRIDQFQDEILMMVSSTVPTQLYQMNMQFFPLTKTDIKDP